MALQFRHLTRRAFPTPDISSGRRVEVLVLGFVEVELGDLRFREGR